MKNSIMIWFGGFLIGVGLTMMVFSAVKFVTKNKSCPTTQQTTQS